jgi:hypothetical protein
MDELPVFEGLGFRVWSLGFRVMSSKEWGLTLGA